MSVIIIIIIIIIIIQFLTTSCKVFTDINES